MAWIFPINVLVELSTLFGNVTVERPKYKVARKLPGGRVEIRWYPPVVAATIQMPRNRFNREGEAFAKLARYIGVSGRPQNAKSREISMTAPVVTSSKSSEEISMTAPVTTQNNEMAFLLPAKYTIETAPQPTDPDVRIRELPGRYEAVLPFFGEPTEWYTEQQVDELKRKVVAAKRDGADIRIKGDWYLARFNPPITIPFLKTNEIHIPVDFTP
mmetsp:Transcript_20844/g.35896  ORF Transcript_20844/g.35896 Transcript_20844/m.35896 type:complete len:215 (+) Transcript_20844:93-737(+)